MLTEEQFAYLAKKYMDTVFRLALHYTKSRSESDDITQEVLLKLYRADKPFESEDHVRHWLIRVTVNECKRAFLSPWKRTEPIEDYAEQLAFKTPEHSELFHAVMALPQKYRVPLFLHYSGTTPGKALLGLSIETEDGDRLSVSEARWRLWGVIWRGGGLGIPILNLFRLYKSMDELLEGHPMPWDDGKVVLLRDAKRWRIPAWCLAAAFAVFLGLLPQAAQRLAPNRGPLTPAQFAENYNYYAWYLDCGSGWLLQPDGTWREPTTENGAVSFYRVHEPDLQIETENGAVTRVSFSFSPEASDPNFYSFYPQMLLSALSLSGAQPEGGLFSGVPARLAEAIPEVPGSFTVTEGGVRLTCDVFSKNYYLTDTICFPDDEAPAGECVFTLTFAAEIQP